MRNSMTQQRRFTKEFEEEAVRLARTSGRTQREIAGDLGIGLSTLVRWIGRSRDRHAIDPSGVASDVTAELKRLRREDEILRQERDLLKKATAFCVREGSRGGSGSSIGRKRSFPSIACAVCSGLAKAAISPGEVGQLVAANVTTWCCWHTSGQPLPCRTEPMAVPVWHGNCGITALRWAAAGSPG